MLTLATIIITGFAPDSLGCPPSALAQEIQTWHAALVRTGEHVAVEVLPGHPFTLTFTLAQPDTFAVRVWGENSAGYGCEQVLTALARDVVSVPPSRSRRTLSRVPFDIQGRRMSPTRSGHYFGPDTLILN